MFYNIHINQRELNKFNITQKDTNKKLTITDWAIIEYLYKQAISEYGIKNSIKINNITYYRLSYNNIIQQLPEFSVGNQHTVGRRIKKLHELNIIIRHIKKIPNGQSAVTTKIYFTPTNIFHSFYGSMSYSTNSSSINNTSLHDFSCNTLHDFSCNTYSTNSSSKQYNLNNTIIDNKEKEKEKEKSTSGINENSTCDFSQSTIESSIVQKIPSKGEDKSAIISTETSSESSKENNIEEYTEKDKEFTKITINTLKGYFSEFHFSWIEEITCLYKNNILKINVNSDRHILKEKLTTIFIREAKAFYKKADITINYNTAICH